MIQKRTAESRKGQPNVKRKAKPHDNSALKSAKSALAVQQGLNQVAQYALQTVGTATKPETGTFMQDDISDDASSDDGSLEGTVSATSQRTVPFLAESQFPKSWKRSRELIVNEALSQAPSSTRILITGTQSSGKATFTQYLARTLLYPHEELDLIPAKSIAILYLDPSRGSEGFVGHVSLRIWERCLDVPGVDGGLGAPKHERNLAVGLYGQRDDIQHYFLALTELLRELQHLSITLPMIVCCPSVERDSERGIDLRSLNRLIALVNPDHICLTNHKAQYTTGVLEMLHAEKKSFTELWELEPLLERSLLSTTDIGIKRHIALESYFNDSSSRSGALALSSSKPYSISYGLGEQATDIGSVFVFGDLPPNHRFMMSRLLNASVVAIAVTPEIKSMTIVKGQGDGIPYTTDIHSASLLRTNSIGFGLIRSVDPEAGVLLIETPEHIAQQLDNVPAEQILLVYGIVGTPDWIFAQDVAVGLQPCYLGSARKGMQTVKSRRFKKKG